MVAACIDDQNLVGMVLAVALGYLSTGLATGPTLVGKVRAACAELDIAYTGLTVPAALDACKHALGLETSGPLIDQADELLTQLGLSLGPPPVARQPRDPRLPKLVVFDLDFTLWHPELYQLSCGPPFQACGDGCVLTRRGERLDLFPAARKALAELHDASVPVAIASRASERAWAEEIMRLLRVDDRRTVSRVGACVHVHGHGHVAWARGTGTWHVARGTWHVAWAWACACACDMGMWHGHGHGHGHVTWACTHLHVHAHLTATQVSDVVGGAPVVIQGGSKVHHLKHVAACSRVPLREMVFFDNERTNIQEVSRARPGGRPAPEMSAPRPDHPACYPVTLSPCYPATLPRRWSHLAQRRVSLRASDLPRSEHPTCLAITRTSWAGRCDVLCFPNAT